MLLLHDYNYLQNSNNIYYVIDSLLPRMSCGSNSAF